MFKKISVCILLASFSIHAMEREVMKTSIESEDEAKVFIEALLVLKHDALIERLQHMPAESQAFVKTIFDKNYHSSIDVSCCHVLKGHSDLIKNVALSADGQVALTGSFDGIRAWDLAKSPASCQLLEQRPDFLSTLALSADGRIAQTVSHDDIVKIWDLSHFPALCIHETKLPNVYEVALNRDGSVSLIKFSKDNNITALVIIPTTCPNPRKEVISGVDSVRLSVNGKVIIATRQDGSVTILDLATQAQRTTRAFGGFRRREVKRVALSNDGQRALIATDDDRVHLWDLSKSALSYRELPGHKSDVGDMALSADNRVAVTNSDCIRIWDLTESRYAPTCRILDYSASRIALSSDGSVLVILKYDYAHGTMATVFNLESDPITPKTFVCPESLDSIDLSADGSTIITVSHGRTARVWKTSRSNPLSLSDSILIHKLRRNSDELADDHDAMDRLKILVNSQAADKEKLVALVYRNQLPEDSKECSICCHSYDPKSKISMAMPCCRQLICSECAGQLRSMTFAYHIDDREVHDPVKVKCPFCNNDQIKRKNIKKFEIDANNHHCSLCDKEKCTKHCSVCKTTYYCSQECQLKDWPTHKTSCKKKEI